MGLIEFFSFDWLHWPGLPLEIAAFFDLTSSSFWLALIFAAVGAYLLSQQTADAGAFSFPVNLAALFLGAAIANGLGGRLGLPLQPAILVPVVFSLIGMSLVGLAIVWVVKRS